MIEHLVLCKPCNRKWKINKGESESGFDGESGSAGNVNLLELGNPGGLTICKHVKAYYC
jgi:hypothetical protein|tara:strand:- start:441 stop:617 length:177 start_codon:yes stop_codon:yes gene_type:complete